jgi:tetratricopeptide (TPR) repeat protein
MALCGVRTPHAAVGTGGYDSPYFQADYIQDLTQFSSCLINPALTYRVNQIHLGFGMYRWALGKKPLGYQHGSFLYPIRRNQTAGLSIVGVSSKIEKTAIDEDLQIVPLGTSRFSDLWFVGTYGVRVIPWLMIGTNLKYRLQNQFGEGNLKINKNGIPGLDLGVYFNPLDHYRFGDLGLSINMQDFIPTKTVWEGSSNENLSASRLRAGLRYSVLNDRVIGAFEVVIDNVFVKIHDAMGLIEETTDSVGQVLTDKETLLKIATRYGGHLRWEMIPQLWLKAGWNNNQIPYVGFNMNFIYPFPEMINYLNVDYAVGYAFIENLYKGDMGDERGFTMMGRVSTDIGPTREQRESKRLYDKLILAPMDAYNEAMRLYLAEKYWEASFAFGKVISLYPNFHLNDKATWYMGNSYRFLHLNDIARDIYKEALEEYTTSEMRSKYLYGLQNLDYREKKFDEALKNHAFITNLYPESDILPDADYLAAQVHFLRKNYNVAEQLLSKIQPGDPTYFYAQYTLSIINIENKKEQVAIQNLMNIVSDTTQDPGVTLLQDAANTKLGHLYFEQTELRKAVEAYMRVPVGSPHGDEALLGTAWSWIKTGVPEGRQQCIASINRLIANHPQSPLVPEAHLVRGYAYMLERQFSDAVSDLERCLELARGDFITQADLKRRETEYQRYVQDFLPVAERIKKNALRKPTDKTIAERPAMKTEFDKFAKENREFFTYTLMAESHKKFFRREEQIIEDAEYALAKATNMLKGRRIIKEQEKVKEEVEEIDDEIKKLEEELQELEGSGE